MVFLTFQITITVSKVSCSCLLGPAVYSTACQVMQECLQKQTVFPPLSVRGTFHDAHSVAWETGWGVMYGECMWCAGVSKEPLGMRNVFYPLTVLFFIFVCAGPSLLSWLFPSWGRAGATLLVAVCWLLAAVACPVSEHGLKGEWAQ